MSATLPRCLRLALGLALSATLLVPSSALAADVDNGELVYVKRCEQCHGPNGDGKGPAWDFMLPRPRIFEENMSYKFRTTASGALPTDQDLYDIISIGIPGTSMPGFAVLPESERWDLVAYLKSLAAEDFEDPDNLEEAYPMPELTGELAPPPATEESLAKGKTLYEEAKCGQCHGELGRGNGPSWPDLKDDWSSPILPANLTNLESYRGGSRPFDIYRTISTGLNGTPMPAYSDSIAPEDRWDLVNYIISLAPPQKAARDETIYATKVDELPADGAGEAWADAPVARFSTLPNIIEPPRLFWNSVEFVMVQALFTDSEIALRIEWDDRSQSEGQDDAKVFEDRDTAIYSNEPHPDQLAVQFPSKVGDGKVRPYMMLGDGKRSVNLWWWSSKDGVIKERNAKGFTSITTQPERGQDVTGRVTYEDGRYTMYVRRSLKTSDPKVDVQIAPGRFVPVGFNVWNGNRGELGQRRSLTTWYWLYLAPPVPETVYTYPPFAFFFSLGLLLIIVRSVRRRVRVAGGDEGVEAASS